MLSTKRLELLSGLSYDDGQSTGSPAAGTAGSNSEELAPRVNCALKYHGPGQTEADTLVHMIRPSVADFLHQLVAVKKLLDKTAKF